MGFFNRLFNKAVGSVTSSIDAHALKALSRGHGAGTVLRGRTEARYAPAHKHETPAPIENRLTTFMNDRGILLPADDHAVQPEGGPS